MKLDLRNLFPQNFLIKTLFKKAFSLIEISIVIIIIAILTAVIYEATEYVSDFAGISAKNLSKSSIVGRVDDLVIWTNGVGDKSLDSTEKKDQENILKWIDSNPKSSAGFSFSAPTQSLRPQFQLSAINSISSVRFLGSNCLASNSFGNVDFDNFVIYLVFMPQSLSDAVIIEKYDANNIAFSLELSKSLYKFSVKDASATIFVNSSKMPKIKQPNLIKISRIKGDKIEIEINGVANWVPDTLTQASSNSKEINIGCRNAINTPSNFLAGLIGEIAIFNRKLTTKEITQIDEYFYKKWKLVKYTGALAYADFCSIPSSLNADPNITQVSVNLSPTTIGCKVNHTGNLSYTCSQQAVLIVSGSCNPIKCTFNQSLYSPQCLTTANGTVDFLVGEGFYNCPSATPMDLKYKCNADGTSQFQIKPRCYVGLGYGYVRFGSVNPFDSGSYMVNCSNDCGFATATYNGIYCAFYSYKCCNPPNVWSF